jgi:hypothetical protein
MGMDRASTSLNQGSAKMAGASEAADAEQIRLVEAQILECNLPEARVFLREDADVGEIDPSDGTRSITGIVSLGVIEAEDGSKKPAVHGEFRTLGNDSDGRDVYYLRPILNANTDSHRGKLT